MKNLLFLSIFLFIIVFNTNGQNKKQKKITLFSNVMVFDGTTNKLLKRDVLVEGNLIKTVSKEPLAITERLCGPAPAEQHCLHPLGRNLLRA